MVVLLFIEWSSSSLKGFMVKKLFPDGRLVIPGEGSE